MGKVNIESGKSFQAQLLANGMDFSKLRNNDLLSKDAWVAVDQAVVQVAKGALNGITDLKNANCIHNLGGIGVLFSQYQTLSDMTSAEVSISGVTESQGDTPEYDLRAALIPVISKDCFINLRQLAASKRNGESLDTSMISISTRLVVEAMEDLLFNGSPIKSGTNEILGYFSHPDVVDAGAPAGVWSDPANIFADFETCLGLLDLAFGNGKYTAYISPALMKYLRQDAKASSALTVRERLLAYPEITDIKSSTAVPAGHMVIVQLTPDVVDWAVGQDLTTVEWKSGNEMQIMMKVMAVAGPRIKSDSNHACPICMMDGIS